MPNKASAAKAMRQTVKRTLRNKIAKAEIESMQVKLRKLLEAKKAKEATELMTLIGKKLDKAVSRGILKLNTVSRTKSRLMKRVNVASKD
ncbi:30S ribosomal protein S20 [Patescibacteria group bacterium]|nr:MAG: 30S ribosomal protein S20 [Patescibacteria group bacterium]